MNEIVINNNPLPIREYKGNRVVTFKEIDTVHGRTDGTARRNFNANKKRFIEGTDYFKIQPNEIRSVGIASPNGGIVLTESGYLMLAKSFTDDLAWTVQRELVNFYFRGKTPVPEHKPPHDKPNKTLAIKEMNAKVRLSNQFLKLSKVETLSTEYKNILVAKAAEALTGVELLPLPKSQQKMYSAREVGQMFGLSANKIGRIAKEHGLKTAEYGEWYRDKARHSTKEVDNFRYNDKAVEKFKAILS